MSLYDKVMSGEILIEDAIVSKMARKPDFYNDKSVSMMTDGIRNRSYKVWNGMIRRCYDPISLLDNPRYLDSTINSEWHNYADFHRWYIEQPNNDVWQCDKDLSRYDSKVYSSKTCMLLPARINSYISQVAAQWDSKRELPVGIIVEDGSYRVVVSGIKFGCHHTLEEAFMEFCEVKQKYLKAICDVEGLDTYTQYLCLRHLYISLCHIAHNYGLNTDLVVLQYVLK